MRENENCRSNDAQPGAIVVAVAMDVTLISRAEPFLASGCEIGAEFFFDVAQQALFAQQPGLHAFCTGASATMQVRGKAYVGATIRAAAITNEIAIRLSIDNFYTTIKARSRASEL